MTCPESDEEPKSFLVACLKILLLIRNLLYINEINY